MISEGKINITQSKIVVLICAIITLILFILTVVINKEFMPVAIVWMISTFILAIMFGFIVYLQERDIK